MPTLTATQLSTIRGALAVLFAFILAQPDIAVPPLVKVGLGAALAVLAFLGKSEPADPGV